MNRRDGNRPCVHRNFAGAESLQRRVCFLIVAVQYLEGRIGLEVLDVLPFDRQRPFAVLGRERDPSTSEGRDFAAHHSAFRNHLVGDRGGGVREQSSNDNGPRGVRTLSINHHA